MSAGPVPPARERPLDADWVRRACEGTQGVAVAEPEAVELARPLHRALAALDALAEQRRFEDEPAGFARAQLRHRQPDTP